MLSLHPTPTPTEKRKTVLLGSLLGTMSPAERAMGRFMRAPDGHGEGGEGGGAESGGGQPGGEGEGGAGGGEGGEDQGAATGAGEGAQGEGEGQGAGGAAEGGEGDGSGSGEGQVTSLAGGAGAKEGEGQPIEVLGAPEAYDLKPPEGMAVDAEALALAEPVLRELNLSNAAAQRLVNLYAGEVLPLLTARAGQQADQLIGDRNAEIRKGWADEAKADKEIGGAKFDETIDLVAQTWDRFGIKPGTGIRLVLDESGLGNHPDMLRFLARVGKATGETPFVPSDGVGSDGRPIWDRIYGQPETAGTGG